MIGNYYYFYWAIAAVVITIIAYSSVLIYAAEFGNQHQSASANNNPEYNSTSTICINNDPCHTVTSNSTNTDNLTNNNKKHTPVSPFPQESVWYQ